MTTTTFSPVMASANERRKTNTTSQQGQYASLVSHDSLQFGGRDQDPKRMGRFKAIGCTAAAIAATIGGAAPAIAATPTSAVTSTSSSACVGQGQSASNITTADLRKGPFAPSDVNLLPPTLYPAASPMAPAANDGKTEAQIKSDLKDVFRKRFGFYSSQVSKGMDVYNNSKLKAVVPDVRLRAAVASLYGTDAEGLITSLKNGDFKKVEFGPLPAGMNPNNVAFSGVKTGDSKATIVFNENFKYEPTRLLGVVAAHEGLHKDTNITNKEELIASALETALYGQLVKEDPSLAKKNTELTRRENVRLMALVNTRTTSGHIRLFEPEGNVYPGGSAPLDNFGSAVPGAKTAADTPGNPYLSSFLSKLAGISGSFSTNTLNALDNGGINRAQSASGWVADANALKLKVNA